MKTNRYAKIILDIFERKYSGQEEFEFERSDLVESCARLGIDPPKNLGDVIANDRIAMFELRFDGDDVEIVNERHYCLVEAGEITGDNLDTYRNSGM